MKTTEIEDRIKLLALEEIERLYQIKEPNEELLSAKMNEIKQWPLIQAILKQPKGECHEHR